MPEISNLSVDQKDLLEFIKKKYPNVLEEAVCNAKNEYLELERKANEELKNSYIGKIFLCRDISNGLDAFTFKTIVDATASINITYHKCFKVYYNVFCFNIVKNKNGLIELKFKSNIHPCAGYLTSFNSDELRVATLRELRTISGPVMFNSVEEAEVFLNLNDDWRDTYERG